MKPFRLLVFLVVLAAFASAVDGRVARADSTPLGRVDRVMADFNAELWWTGFPNVLQVLAGVAHIQVHAYDVDTAPVVEPFAQTGDVGWTKCEPVGTPQCSVFPNGGEQTNIRRVSLSSEGAFIWMNNSLALWLIDGGAPGNEAVPGDRTRDQIKTFTPSGRIIQFGLLLDGNVTTHRY